MVVAAVEVISPAQLRGELKQGDFARVYLLAGPDNFRIEKTARWLREKALEGPMGELNAASAWGDETPPARIAQDASAYPMFGGQRFLWVRHAEGLPSGEAIEPLLAYLKNPVDSTVLVLTSAKLDKRLKLSAACAAAGRVVEFAALNAQELQAQVSSQARAHDIQLEAQAIQMLVDLVGEDLSEIDQELQKLALQGASGPIGAEEVRQLVARSRAIDGFELADSLDQRRPEGLLRAWTELRRRGADPFGNAAILSWRLRQLVLLQELVSEGHPPRDAASLAGLPPWQARKLIPLVESHTPESLQKALEGFVRADRRAKSSSMGAGIAWDLAILDWAAGHATG
ncbi:DNA polymerase III subunit delta [bacterium]|nr:MAG: DNA polymerase III subunit delta [bacterium]